MDDLNGIDGKINLRGYFERILTERGKIEDEREKRLNERFQAQEKAIGKAENRLDSTLQGFPQEYARRLELEQMIAALDETSTVLAQKVVDSAKALAEAQQKVEARTDQRITVLEKFQNKLLGIALAAPFLTGLAVWILTTGT